MNIAAYNDQRYQRTPAGAAYIARASQVRGGLSPELKAPDDKLPQSALLKAGYEAIWQG